MLHTHFLPPQASVLSSDHVALVTDVLRATSVMCRAFDSGVTEIFPCLELEEATQLSASIPGSLLCGERQGLKPIGFTLGNSPLEYTAATCAGRSMVMTTTNGTRALISSLGSDHVYVFAFNNMQAVFEEVRDQNREIHLICAGTDGLPSWEDTLAAGMLASFLAKSGHEIGDDATRIAISLYEQELTGLSLFGQGYQPRLFESLKKGRGGRRVCSIGLEKDLVEVARLNEFAILSKVVKKPLRIVRVAQDLKSS
ncbi:MAG: putative 2-phosphosulfolactate phosphatase [Planctomycetota bacterium]